MWRQPSFKAPGRPTTCFLLQGTLWLGWKQGVRWGTVIWVMHNIEPNFTRKVPDILVYSIQVQEKITFSRGISCLLYHVQAFIIVISNASADYIFQQCYLHLRWHYSWWYHSLSCIWLFNVDKISDISLSLQRTSFSSLFHHFSAATFYSMSVSNSNPVWSYFSEKADSHNYPVQ